MVIVWLKLVCLFRSVTLKNAFHPAIKTDGLDWIAAATT